MRTVNAFPFGDFHEDVVKHQVYEPSWTDLRRSDYTYQRATFLMGHLEEGESASVSTVPLGWSLGAHELKTAGEMLRGLAVSLDETSQRSRGRRATIDLEPEPGCVLDTSEDVVSFFDEHLDNSYARKQIGVCHDVCHASVMFEDQYEALKRYVDAGVAVNKVQVSNAPRAVFGTESVETLRAINAFHEERYLHQTCARTRSRRHHVLRGPHPRAEARPRGARGVADAFPRAGLPRFVGRARHDAGDILACMDACAELGLDPMWEVETYAWNVLPEEFRVDDLAEGIARELAWTRERLDERGLLGGRSGG